MKMIINGEFSDGSSREYLKITSPATGELIDTVPCGTSADIDNAICAAGYAFDKWKNTPLHERSSIIMKFVDLVKENFSELAATLCKDNGKPLSQAEKELSNIFISVPAFVEKAKHLYDHVIPAGSEKNYEKALQYVSRNPLGVIVCIIPFNFPSNLFIQKVIPSLLAGNCVLVLPPSGNPLTVMSLCSLLVRSGVPSGVINCVTAPGNIKESAVTDPRVSLVTFTGSTSTGIRIAQSAAPNLTRTALELGGNDPFIVMKDADMDLVISELFVGRLINAGQICCASKRFIVHNSVMDEFVSKAAGYISSLKMGDPMDRDTDIGCLINENAAIKVEDQIRQTVSQGAEIYLGGKRQDAYFEPTILTGINKEMDIMKDMEVFGPILPVIGFEDDEEALEIANNTMYGLSSCVFSENHRALLKMSSRLNAGNVVINGASNLRSFEIPFGGWKKSGIGTEGVMSTFDEVTQTKVITMKGYEF